MKKLFIFAFLILLSNISFGQTQIPTLQVCNQLNAQGGGTVHIDTRGFPGTFDIKLFLRCDPKLSPYPSGEVHIINLNMNDNSVAGDISSISLEQVSSAGKVTPTLYLNGRCKARYPTGAPVPGCRFWMMLVDNRPVGTNYLAQDIVSFLVFDGTGKRIAYATGPLVKGDITIAPSPD